MARKKRESDASDDPATFQAQKDQREDPEVPGTQENDDAVAAEARKELLANESPAEKERREREEAAEKVG